MKKKQIAQLGVTLGLVAAVGVGGTLALLQANTEEVSNTFTVGAGLVDANLELDETDVDNSTPNAERDKANTYKNIEPQSELKKDPQVRITANEGATIADSYVFIEVRGCDAFLTAVNDGLTSGTDDALSDFNGWNAGWIKIDEEGDEDTTLGYDGVYVWGGTEGTTPTAVNAGFAQYVFTGITLTKDAALYDEGAGKALSEITIDACAVQATSADTAYTDAVSELPTDFFDAQ